MTLGRTVVVAATVLALGLGTTSRAAPFSNSYVFKSGVRLEVGGATSDGMRLDHVLFRVPEGGSSGPLVAEVAVSNTTRERSRIGVAIALFDAQGRLVGVASGGTTLLPVKAGRQKTLKLVFDHVARSAAAAATFHVALESR